MEALRVTALAAAALLAPLAATPLRAQQPPAPAAVAGGSDAALMHVGDRLTLDVEGEQALTGTFTVLDGPSVVLPTIGTIPLAGVTRDGVEAYLTGQLARYIRRPVVHARALLWVGVVGEVSRPGYYALGADALLSDALMAAGGMTNLAQVKNVKIVRANSDVRNASATREALAKGLTLAEIGIESGDQVLVPKQADAERLTRIIGYILAIPLTTFAIIKIL